MELNQANDSTERITLIIESKKIHEPWSIDLEIIKVYKKYRNQVLTVQYLIWTDETKENISNSIQHVNMHLHDTTALT